MVTNSKNPTENGSSGNTSSDVEQYRCSRAATTIVVAAFALAFLPLALRHRDSHSHHDQVQIILEVFAQQSSSASQTWLEKYGRQVDQVFSGPLSFSHLPYLRSFEDENAQFDITLLGMPFDIAVTYRPGAPFRLCCSVRGRRQREIRGHTPRMRSSLQTQESQGACSQSYHTFLVTKLQSRLLFIVTNGGCGAPG